LGSGWFWSKKFLQERWPFCHLTNSVKALKDDNDSMLSVLPPCQNRSRTLCWLYGLPCPPAWRKRSSCNSNGIPDLEITCFHHAVMVIHKHQETGNKIRKNNHTTIAVMVIALVDIYKYSTVRHPDCATECISVGHQRNDGSLDISEPSPEIHESQQYLLDSVLHHFRSDRYAQHYIAFSPAISVKLNLELKKWSIKCLVWSIALYDAQTWTLIQADRSRLEAFEMWIWRRMEKINWKGKKTNEEILHMVQEDKKILNIVVLSAQVDGSCFMAWQNTASH